MTRRDPYGLRRTSAVSTGAVGGLCLLVLVLGILWFSVVSFILMLLWNAVVPALFGGPTIDFPQAFALNALITLLSSLLRSQVTVNRS